MNDERLQNAVLDVYAAYTKKAKRDVQKAALADFANAHMLTGAQAKHLRENELRLGITELANMLGVSRGTVHNWEQTNEPIKLWYALGIHYLLVATE